MARRKKTPDVLANQQRDAQQISTPSAATSDLSGSQSSNEAEARSKSSTPGPLETLFPSAASTAASSIIKVKLTVTSATDIARKIEDAITQALGALPEVQLVAKEEDWTLIVLGTALQAPARQPYGVALSVVAVETEPHRLRKRQRLQPDSSSAPPSERPGIFRGAWLRVTTCSQLERLCQQLVADFESRYLANQRIVRQR
jgi:hypothetical protein